MKFRSSCCCWLTLLLVVGSSIISVSPNSSTTATTTFQKHQKQSIYVHNPASSLGGLYQQQPTTPTPATNNFESLENYHFASTTMSQKQQQHQQTQFVPGSMTTSPFPFTTSTFSSTKLSSSSGLESTLSLSSSLSTKSTRLRRAATSVEINSTAISRRKTRSIDDKKDDDDEDEHYDDYSSYTAISSFDTAAASAASGEMVHHHYPKQRTTESYPSMFFQLSAPPKEHYRSQITNKRSKRDGVMNDDFVVDKCFKFVVGDPDQKMLFSPDYPHNYPKNINCTRLIEAPKGQLIRLDFRDSFNIEDKEECKFDYLEIRDGPYGFSNLIGKYCGEVFPPIITSRERHLWLHFHSDESIEYSGFTAVYEFIDRPKEVYSTELNCTLEKGGYDGYVNSTDVPDYVHSNVTKFKIPLDCMWIITVKESWKIQLKFLHFSLSKPNDCDTNFIDIFSEDTTIPSRMKNFCGSTGEPLASTSNVLHIRFFADQIAINSSFAILYTAFRDKGSDACKEGEYDCEDATCIDARLKCNGEANCKFRWDEENCKTTEEEMSDHVIIIFVVFGLILGGMVVTFLVNCVRKIKRDQKIIREHIRQSKESKLDEMGRSRSRSKQRSRDNVSGVLSPRQKHSQTSLQILDDVSQRYYREAVPISVQTGKTDLKDLKDLKDHSILRHHHDMVVQTSLCDDSSTPDRGIITGVGSGNVCDMGCQTRESLFQPLVRQKSITSSSPNQSTAAAIRFSTFGYDIPPPPITTSHGHGVGGGGVGSGVGQKSATLSRQSSINNHPESIELEERLRTASHNSQHHYSHSHGYTYSGGSSVDPVQAPTMRPPQEMCHHHHQHQQHLQKHQMQQQLPASNTGTMGGGGHHHSHQHSHQHQAPPPSSGVKASGMMGGGGTTTGSSVGGTGKHHKLDETSKVFIDIRNSAPDVIIMTSH